MEPHRVKTGCKIALLLPLTALATLVFGVTAQMGNSGDDIPDCLAASSSESGESATTCTTKDPLRLSTDHDIEEMERALGLAPQEVIFFGCSDISFSAAILHTVPSLTIRISYPVSPELGRSDYLAPLGHELGHAYQLKQAGSIAVLQHSMTPFHRRVELGADFLAGLSLKRLAIATSSFELNEALTGSYKQDLKDPHGLPHERISAFRYGYFYEPARSPLKDKYEYFQNDLYSSLKPSL